MAFTHVTVLREEAVRHLNVRPGGIYVDGTIGGGGHAEAILSAAPGVRLIGIDRDPAALAAAKDRLSAWDGQVLLHRANYADMADVLAATNTPAVDGVLLDLGVSSPQFDEGERGFSYQQDAPLDMRMDPAQQLTAADLVNTASEQELTRILREYGEERWAARIAAFIVKSRTRGPVATTTQLAAIVKDAIPAAARRQGPHPARRTFQALRIAVNDELGSLQQGLVAAVDVLAASGRLAVITFHSLEDSMVKLFMRKEQKPCVCRPELPCVCGKQPRLRVVTPKGVKPSPAEVAHNPRSRSATLRVAERVLSAKENA